MPWIDYWGIRQEIRDILKDDADLSGVNVSIEDENYFAAERSPWVGVYLERRDAPIGIQRISAGQQTTYELRFILWCWVYSLEGVPDAIRRRDDVLARVEVALMRQRTLRGKVDHIRLEGGEMPSGRDPDANGFMSGAEIIMIAQIKTTTV